MWTVLAASTPAIAEMSAEDLAKLAQNPVGILISLPFQNNTNLHYGPERGTQNILNIQPVIPISINKDWNIITRTIVPVISMPDLAPDIDPDRRLDRGQRQPLDHSARRRRRQDLPSWQAAGEYTVVGLLQRGHAG